MTVASKPLTRRAALAMVGGGVTAALAGCQDTPASSTPAGGREWTAGPSVSVTATATTTVAAERSTTAVHPTTEAVTSPPSTTLTTPPATATTPGGPGGGGGGTDATTTPSTGPPPTQGPTATPTATTAQRTTVDVTRKDSRQVRLSLSTLTARSAAGYVQNRDGGPLTVRVHVRYEAADDGELLAEETFTFEALADRAKGRFDSEYDGGADDVSLTVQTEVADG